MKILFQYHKNDVKPRISIDGKKYDVVNTMTGSIESDLDTLPERYVEYELKELEDEN